MSFKRDGDDLNLLNRLKHQRVSELLGTHIPEDEAKLLRNGRLTCLICHSRPIFDTVAMLAKHRKGKKHLLELSRYIKKKQELELEIMKRQQLNSVKDLSGLTLQSVLDAARHHAQDGPLGKMNEGCVLQRRKTLELPALSPHVSEFLFPDSPIVSNASQVRRYLKNLPRKKSLDSVIDHMRENYGSVSNIENVSKETLSPLKENTNKLSPPRTQATSSVVCQNSVLDDFNRNLSGWIKDIHGNWIRDENAEFDSDEDLTSAVSPR